MSYASVRVFRWVLRPLPVRRANDGARSLLGPEGLYVPGFRLHELKGSRRGQRAVSVSGNWQVTFRFEDGSATDVDYVDYC